MGDKFDLYKRVKDIKEITELYLKERYEEEKRKEKGIELVNSNTRSELRIVTAKGDEYCSIYSNKEQTRKNKIKKILNDTKYLISSISDLEFQRRKDEILKVENDNTDFFNGKTYDELTEISKKLLSDFKKCISKLNNAFIPSKMTKVLLKDLMVYRNKLYSEITNIYGQIILICKEMSKFTSFKDEKEIGKRCVDKKVKEIKSKGNESIKELENKSKNKVKEINDKYENLYRSLKSAGVISGDKGAFFGELVYEAGLDLKDSFLKEYFRVNENNLIYTLKADELKRSILLTKKNNKDISKYICNLTYELLDSSLKTNIYIFDRNSMGNNYRVLNPLLKTSRLKIFRNEEEFKTGINELEQIILSSNSINKRAYLFIDNINLDIGENELYKLSKIILNGEKVGITSIITVNKEDLNEKWKSKIVRVLEESISTFRLENEKVILKENEFIYLPNKLDEKRITSCYERITKKEKKKDLVSIRDAIKDRNMWGKGTTKYGISIPIGIDKAGNEFEFTLKEDKPYGLISGDVGSGKSSLFQTIILMSSILYDDSELKLAIGDFKNGAEFNIYANTKQKNIDAVICNEDPYVINSFLSYYLKEISKRQMIFNELSSKTNKLIRKYEEYREVLEKNTYGVEKLPRILILIDEYQTVFDGNSNSANLLIKMIRKGRTYGIHILMASQRAMSDDTRNGFTQELKNMFSARFLFMSPQIAARMLLNDKCSDTGKENSGISLAPLLKQGEVIYNSYLGQSEKDNHILKIYYSDSDVIKKICEINNLYYGTGKPILLKENEKSIKGISFKDRIVIGKSIGLLIDKFKEDGDEIIDSNYVSIKENTKNNILAIGKSIDFKLSLIISTLRFALNNGTKVNLIGEENDEIISYFNNSEQNEIRVLKDEEMILKTLKEQLDGKERNINIILGASKIETFKGHGIKKSLGQELLSSLANDNRNLFIFFEDKYKTFKSELIDIQSGVSIHIIGISELENLRAVLPDSYKYVETSFDLKDPESIKAYYYNKNTNKIGKVILFKN